MTRPPLYIALGLALLWFPPVHPMQFSSNSALELGTAGFALTRTSVAILSVPILNRSVSPIEDIQVTQASYGHARLLFPSAFPYSLGNLSSQAATVFQPRFDDSALVFGRQYPLAIEGYYSQNRSVQPFRLSADVPFPDPGTPDGSTERDISYVIGQYTHGRYDAGDDSPEDEAGQQFGFAAPQGQVRPVEYNHPTEVERPELVKVTNAPTAGLRTSILTKLPLGWRASSTAEPSFAVSAGGVVLYTFNRFDAISKDGGRSFEGFNARSVLPDRFENRRRLGFVEDQDVQYSSHAGRFFWVLQYTGNENDARKVIRIASATPEEATRETPRWRYWDFRATDFGFENNMWLDFPRLAMTDTWLYVGLLVYRGESDKPENFVARVTLTLRLADVQRNAERVRRTSYQERNERAWAAALTQNETGRIHWARHKNTSEMRILTAEDEAPRYTVYDVQTYSFTGANEGNSNYASLDPDGVNWMPSISYQEEIQGATRIGNEVWFAWTSAKDDTYTQPNIRIEKISTRNYRSLSQQIIWNRRFAWSLPALHVNSNGDVGMAFAVGGGGGYPYPNFGAGILTGEAHFLVETSGSRSPVPPVNFGDYFTIRPYTPNPKLFAAAGYALNRVRRDQDPVQLVFTVYGRASDF
jgi:hypothetical protein